MTKEEQRLFKNFGGAVQILLDRRNEQPGDRGRAIQLLNDAKTIWDDRLPDWHEDSNLKRLRGKFDISFDEVGQ